MIRSTYPALQVVPHPQVILKRLHATQKLLNNI
jgi:hypothetical protein